jgi:hypothetical protein
MFSQSALESVKVAAEYGNGILEIIPVNRVLSAMNGSLFGKSQLLDNPAP